MYQLLLLFFFALLLAIVYNLFFVLSQDEPDPTHTPFNPVKFDYDHSTTIRNTLECSLANLNKCSTKDHTSCFGCKDLTSSCQHFDSDTRAKIDGVEMTIPANASPEEGYCLPLTVFSSRCNPYHGEFIVGGVDGRYGLFCICKNPGIVTNTELNGPCESRSNAVPYPFENVNVPLDKLTLQCPSGTKSGRTVNNVPTCLPLQVKDAGVYRLEAQTEDGNFNSYLNEPTDVVLTYDPCTYCLVTGQPVQGTTLEASTNGFVCKGSPQGFPIRRDPGERLLKGTVGPDAVLKMPDRYILYQVITSKFGVDEWHSYFVITFDEMRGWEPWHVKTAISSESNLYYYYFDSSHQIRFPFSWNTLTIGQLKSLHSILHLYHALFNVVENNGYSAEYCTMDAFPTFSDFQQVKFKYYETYGLLYDQGVLKREMNKLLTDETVPNRVEEYRKELADKFPFRVGAYYHWQWSNPKFIFGAEEKKFPIPPDSVTDTNWNLVPGSIMVSVGQLVGMWVKQPNDNALYGGFLDSKLSATFREYYDSLPAFSPPARDSSMNK